MLGCAGAGPSAETPTATEQGVTASEIADLAEEAYRAGSWSECAELYARASSLLDAGAHETASYNAACCHAMAGNSDGAFIELARTIEAGFRDAAHLQQDGDLTSLYGDPRWEDAVARVAAASEAYRAGINVELLELYEQDQADRSGGSGGIDWGAVGPRDEQRRERVTEIMAASEAEAADDYYHAAMVFQHGSEPEHFNMAHEWALRAAELDPDHGNAKWLAAAAEDRYLMNLGKPQKYGTQFRTDDDGRWILYEVDPSVTDEHRAEWNVPPLHKAQARAEQMNR
jgi:hypothetical protein